MARSIYEAVYDPVLKVEVPRRLRDVLAGAYPPLLGRYPTHKAYAEAALEQVLAVFPKPAEKVEAVTLASTVFFNRTNHFEAVALPYAAQVAPVFAVNVGDFDGDGNEDIFLSQNFFGRQRADSGRMTPDAGCGCAVWVAADWKRYRGRSPAF